MIQNIAKTMPEENQSNDKKQEATEQKSILLPLGSEPKIECPIGQEADAQGGQCQSGDRKGWHWLHCMTAYEWAQVILTVLVAIFTVVGLKILQKQNDLMGGQTELMGRQTKAMNRQTELMDRQLAEAQKGSAQAEEQWRTSLKTNADLSQKAMESSAAQSKAALDAGIDNARLDQRAWVGPSTHTIPSFSDNNRSTFLKVGARTPLGVDIANTGKTPAMNLAGRLAVGVRSNRERFEPRLGPVGGAPSLATLFPGQHFRLSLNFPSDDGTVSQQVVDEIKSGRSTLYVYGRIEYQDIFKKLHITTFCLSMNREMDSLNSCSVYNDAN